MTCQRKPLSIEKILQDALRVLTDVDIEDYTSKSRNWFEKCSNPNNASQISMQDAEALDNALAVNGHPRWFSDHWSRHTKTDDEREAECLYREFLSFHGSVAELGATIERIMADGVCDEAEKAELHDVALRVENKVSKFKKPAQSAVGRRNGEQVAKNIRETTVKLATSLEGVRK